MENIGERLKAAREQRNKSYEEIYARSRIPIEYLKHLENNNFDFLPEAYVKSFLKTYASMLKLDTEEILGYYLQKKEAERRALEEQRRQAELHKKPKVRSQVVEWALGIGAVILLLSLIFVYIQYRSHIYAKPVSSPQSSSWHENAAASNGSKEVKRAANQNIISPIEIEITALDRVWLQLIIDDQRVREYTLSAQQNLLWIAESKFEIIVSDAGAIRCKFRGKEIDYIGEPGEKVRLSFNKHGLVERKKIRENLPPSS